MGCVPEIKSMKSTFFAVLVLPLLLCVQLKAEEKIDHSRQLPVFWNGVNQIESGERTPDGEPVLAFRSRYGAAELVWPSAVAFRAPVECFAPAGKGEIHFWLKGPQGRNIRMRLQSIDLAGAITVRYAEAAVVQLTGEWQKVCYAFAITRPLRGRELDAPRFALLDAQAGDGFMVGPFSIVQRGERPEKTAAVDHTAAVPAGWRPISTEKLYVKPGSALDFSEIVPRHYAGKYGRVICNEHGELAFASSPRQPLRFVAIQNIHNPHASKNEISEYAQAAARQGYNMIRLHSLDSLLCGSRISGGRLKKGVQVRGELPQQADEVRFDPAMLDRFFFMVSEMKRNGLYLYLDCMTSSTAYDNGNGAPDSLSGSDQTATVQMFVSPRYRKNWEAGVTKLFTAVNPYTGLALKDDPAVVFVNLFNEQDILLGQRNYGNAFHPEYTAFLKRKYGTVDRLREHWGEDAGNADSFEQVPKFGQKRGKSGSGMESAMAEFVGYMMRQMDEYYASVLKRIGYTGLYSNWNMRPFLASATARAQLPLITLNYYHAHPRYGKIMEVSQKSALQNFGNSFNDMSTVRFLDRPFAVTEYGLVFWNRYRHEQGLLFGAGAALQDWSVLTAHTDHVLESGTKLECFKIGDDPVSRASEQIAMLAFLRGDVQRSPHSLEIALDDRFISSKPASHGIGGEYSQLWPLLRIGVGYGERHTEDKPDLVLHPTQTSGFGGGLAFTEREKSTPQGIAGEVIGQLRRKGVLGPENRSDAKAGIMQSDTGEITVTSQNGGEMTVETPRLCGAVLKRDREVTAGAMTVQKATVPASLVIASLDRSKCIAESRHLLLFITTNALNSDMKFLDGEHSRLQDGSGSLPVLVQTGRFDFSFDRADKTERNAVCYVLALNGERVGEVPAVYRNGRLLLSVDTAQTPGEPSPYYEIVIP